MPVAALTQFPDSFIAGDTVRVTFSDSRFPSTLWSAKVLLRSATTVKPFTAEAGTGTSFDVEISAADSAKLAPGLYVISYVYTETATSERQTDDLCTVVTVYANPEKGPNKSLARQTLEAMQEALLLLAKDPKLSVNFVGQSFTNRNLKEFQDAIDRQRSIVESEDATLTGHRRIAAIYHPI